MKQTELPLYPKISSIYNKIMQLSIAIVFIIVLMNIWLATGRNDKEAIDQHFSFVSHHYLQQAALSVQVFLKNDDKKALKQYIEQLSTMTFVESAHFYDPRGQLIFSSVSAIAAKESTDLKPRLSVEESSINDLYGISPQKSNLSKRYLPFVQEVRAEKLLGYLRITIEKSIVNEESYFFSEQRQSLIRLMLILAGCVGFLLTRGLNRFSRQGYRLAKPTK
jgi:membrane protein